MIGNHYPLAFATKYSWAILALVIIMGCVIRVYFNTMHKGIQPPLWPWAVAALCMLTIIALSSLGPRTQAQAALPVAPVSLTEVNSIVSSRCSMCHAAEPVWEGIAEAPKGVMLDTPEQVALHIHQVGMQAGLSNAMPPGNVTEITPEERQVLANWVIAGVKPD